MKRRIIAGMLGIVLAAQSPLSAAAVNAAEVLPDQAEAEYVVQAENVEAVEELLGTQEGAELPEAMAEDLQEQNVVVLKLTEAEAEALEQRADIVSVEEDVVLYASSTGYEEDDAGEETELQAFTGGLEQIREKKRSYKTEKIDRRNEQWNLEAIRLVEGTEGAGGVKVGVLDSGVSFTDDLDVAENIDLAGGEDDVNPMFEDATGHGTGIAGMIGALDNEDGIRGINPDAEICSIRILDENNRTTLSKAVAGIYQAIESDCDILNMSFGTEVNSPVLYEAVRSAYDAGMLLVAAGGNQAGKAVEYPAAYPEVMAVGATDASGNWMTNTCDGPEIEIYAPGSQIPTSGLFGGTAIVEGTSIAAAQVTGAASLLWAKDKSKSAGFIRALLANTAQHVQEAGCAGAGLLDIENAFVFYDDMEASYIEETLDYAEIQESGREAEAFEDVKLISGSWMTNTDHVNLVTSAADGLGISSTNIQLMSTTARLADSTYRSASMLHATGNYVQALKFLCRCAFRLKKGDTIETAIDTASAFAGFSGKPTENELKKQTAAMLKADVLANVSESSAKARYFKTMGFAMHLTGDTFAHRTIVPKYTVAGTNPTNPVNSTSITSANARFGTKHFTVDANHTKHSDDQLKAWARSSAELVDETCKKWKCFQRTVNLGVMEFKDVKNFAKSSERSNAAKDYEDNKNFCKERYEDAQTACDTALCNSVTNTTYDGVEVFCPLEKYVVLNNFKNYAKAAGEDISVMTDAEWMEVSTPAMY